MQSCSKQCLGTLKIYTNQIAGHKGLLHNEQAAGKRLRLTADDRMSVAVAEEPDFCL